MSSEKKTFRISYVCFRAIRWLAQLFYPKFRIEGAENLPDESCIVVGNHSQVNGPGACELYFPGEYAIWCAGQMMELKEVPDYAYQDFWSGKPKYIRWFYRIASYVIAPFSVCVFNNAHTIPVYRDARLISTFRKTAEALEGGMNVIVFPECAEKHNCIVNQFQDKFIDVAKFYYKRTGRALSFVPMYVAPRLKTLYLGKPIVFCPDAPMVQERHRICGRLMDEITDIAVHLPKHTVVPYNNVSKRLYPTNIPCEVISDHEKTDG